jgi:two-component system NtrC family sensor kinase
VERPADVTATPAGGTLHVRTPPGGVRWTLPRDRATWLAVLAQAVSFTVLLMAWIEPFGRTLSSFVARTLLAVALTLLAPACVFAARRSFGPRRAFVVGLAASAAFGALGQWYTVLRLGLAGHTDYPLGQPVTRVVAIFLTHPALMLGLAAAVGWRRNAIRLEVLLDTLLVALAAAIVGVQAAYFTAPPFEVATALSRALYLFASGIPIAEILLVALLLLTRAEALTSRAARGIALGTLFMSLAIMMQGRVPVVGDWSAMQLNGQLGALAVFSFASGLHAGPTIARFYDTDGASWIPYVRGRFILLATVVASASMVVLGFRERRSPELAIALALFVLLLAVRAGRVLVLQERQAQLLASSVQVERALSTTLEQRVAERTSELAEAQRVLQRMWILGQQVTLELQPTRVLQRFMEAVADIAQADGGALGLLSGDAGPGSRIRIAATIGAGTSLADAELPLDGSAMGSAIRGRQPWTREDLTKDSTGVHPLERVVMTRGQARGAAVIPVEQRGELAGALLLVSRKPRRFSDDDLARIQSMTDMLSVALANAELVETIRRAESRFRALFRAAPDTVLTVLGDGRIREANDQVRELTGLTPEQAVGLPLADLVAEDDRDPLQALLDAAFRGWAGRTELRVLRNAETRTVSLAASHLPEADPPTVLLVARDITGERELMAHVAASQRRVAVGELISGVAHQVNNPLSSISAYGQLLAADGKLTAEQREAAEVIVSEARRAGQVVRDLLIFAGRSEPERRPLDAGELLERTLRLNATELDAAGVEVEARFTAGLPPVMVDERQMQHALLHLVTNAAQAMAPGGGGTLRVETRLSDGRVCIEIADTGPGIPAAARERIFEPFYTTRSAGEGQGLGLSVCYGIVEAHGGGLELADSDGIGARFIISLPPAAAASGAAAAPAPPSEPAGRPRKARGDRPARTRTARSPLAGLRLLFVDDEPLLRSGMEAFGRARGVEVVTAESGPAALEIIRAREVDAVVCDVRMPGMDGVAFHQTLQREQPTLAARTVFVTGDVIGTDGRYAVTGHQPTLVKPFSFDRLEQLLLEVLRDQAAGDTAPVRR